MAKRKAIRWITFLSAGVIVLGVLAWTGIRKANTLELYARANTQHAFDELVTSVSALSTDLEKSVYVTDPALESALCTQMFGKAVTAQTAVGVLPYSSQELEQTATFLSKVGDYACVLSRTVGKNGGYSEEELANLKELAALAQVMALNLQDMQARILAGDLDMEEVYAETFAARAGQDEEQAPLAGTVFETMEAEFPEFPTLIYDGPFSEALTDRTPVYLDGRDEISESDAITAAAECLDVSEDSVSLSGQMEGDIPCYICSAYVGGAEYTVYVTRQGGEIMSVLCSRATGEQTLSVDKGRSMAKDILQQMGMKGMQESYYVIEDGVLLVNFEYAQDGVLCYPDLVKVGVALDNGALMSYDAKGYLTCHTKRDIPTASVTREEAEGSVSSDLLVTDYNMAVIPSEGGEERLCHEFVCETEEGERYILYVNALTGDQEKILILLEDDTGTLTI